jgi:hypothetical protein
MEQDCGIGGKDVSRKQSVDLLDPDHYRRRCDLSLVSWSNQFCQLM